MAHSKLTSPLLLATLLTCLSLQGCLRTDPQPEESSAEPTTQRPLLPGTGSSIPAGLEAIPVPNLEGLAPALAQRLAEDIQRAERRALGELGTQAEPTPSARDEVETARAYGDLGLRLAAFDLLDAAGAAFRNATQLDPTSSRWPHFLGLLTFEEGDLGQATRHFQAALALEEESNVLRHALLLHLVTAHLQAGQPGLASEPLGELLEIEPGLAAAHARLGEMASAVGDPARAAAAFRHALDLQPEADALHYSLAQAYRDQGEDALAAQHLAARGEREVRWTDPRLRELADAINRGVVEVLLTEIAKPNRFDAAATLDFARSNLGHVEGSAQALEQQLELALQKAREQGGRLDPVIHARFRYLLGGLLVHANEDRAAIEALRQAVGLDATLLDGHLKLANALARTGHLDEATAAYGQVLTLEPNHAAALLRRGTLHLESGRLSQAVADLEGAATKVSPNGRPDALLRLAVARLLAGDQAGYEAERQALLALDLTPDQQLRSRLNLATALGRTGHREEAAREYEACLTLSPSLPQAVQGLASLAEAR